MITPDKPPVQPVTQPPSPQASPAPQQGNVLHLRNPTSKREKRLGARIMKELKTRNRLMKEMLRCTRAIAKLEVELQNAGMITGRSQAGQPPTPPAPKGEAESEAG